MLDLAYPKVNPGPPRPSRIVTPVSLALRLGVERYEVPGGGAILVTLGAGDRVTVVNTEGGQVAELVAADGKGAIDAAILGVAPNGRAEGLKALLTRGQGQGLGGLRLGLERRGIDLAKAGALSVFGDNTPAGTEAEFVAARDGVLIVAAPGPVMAPDAQNTVTPLGLRIQRAALIKVGQYDLPDPLADPVLDLRVKSCTAQAYFVKAGDYIQVIFICFVFWK